MSDSETDRNNFIIKEKVNKIDKEYNDCLVEKSLLYENIKE